MRKYFAFIIVVFSLVACNQSKTESDSNIDSKVAEVNSHPEYTKVKASIEDYLLALYDVDTSRIENSVDTSLRKIGYWFDKENDVYRDNLEMTYGQLHRLSGNWNAEGDRIDENSPRDIEIHEINDKTAVGKLTAEWGIDYFQLANVDGNWKIMNVLWQSHPPE